MSGGGGRLGWAGGVKPPVTLNVRRKRNLKKGQKRRGKKKQPQSPGCSRCAGAILGFDAAGASEGFFCLVKAWGCSSGCSWQGWGALGVLSLSQPRYHPQNCHLSPQQQFLPGTATAVLCFWKEREALRLMQLLC